MLKSSSRSEKLRASWRDPAIRLARTQGIAATNSKRMRDPEIRAKHLAAIAEAQAKPEWQANVAAAGQRRRGENHPNWWRGDSVGYHGMHQRLGPARIGVCVDCDGPAREWSLQPGVPAERLRRVQLWWREKLTAYSIDPADYVRRCHRCHCVTDGELTCEKGHPWTQDSTYRRPDGRAKRCRICAKTRRAERTTREAAPRTHEDALREQEAQEQEEENA